MSQSIPSLKLLTIFEILEQDLFTKSIIEVYTERFARKCRCYCACSARSNFIGRRNPTATVVTVKLLSRQIRLNNSAHAQSPVQFQVDLPVYSSECRRASTVQSVIGRLVAGRNSCEKQMRTIGPWGMWHVRLFCFCTLYRLGTGLLGPCNSHPFAPPSRSRLPFTNRPTTYSPSQVHALLYTNKNSRCTRVWNPNTHLQPNIKRAGTRKPLNRCPEVGLRPASYCQRLKPWLSFFFLHLFLDPFIHMLVANRLRITIRFRSFRWPSFELFFSFICCAVYSFHRHCQGRQLHILAIIGDHIFGDRIVSSFLEALQGFRVFLFHFLFQSVSPCDNAAEGEVRSGWSPWHYR